VRIADDEQDEVVLLGQSGEDEVFRVATGADRLRLRPPVFALRDAFPRSQEAAADSAVTITGRYRTGVVTLTAKRDDFAGARDISLAPSLGWTLLLPFQWPIEGTPMERVASFLWTSVLLLPIGFWLRCATIDRGAGGRVRMAVSLGVLTVVCLGLAWVPLVYGVSGASIVDWCAGLTGLAGGALLASVAVGKGARAPRSRGQFV
jgi:hypothetical protein